MPLDLSDVWRRIVMIMIRSVYRLYRLFLIIYCSKDFIFLPISCYEIGDHHAGRYTKIGRGGRVYAMGSGIYAVERLEGACGA